MSKPKRTLDRYDLEIEDIKKEVKAGADVREVIFSHWSALARKGGLFSYCSPNRTNKGSKGSKGYVGCLTQIKGYVPYFSAADAQLTVAIRKSSLPGDYNLVELRHLHQFARWQRKMDAMWPGRGKMQMPEGFEERLRKANS